MHKLTVACLMAAVLCMVEPAATVSKHAVGVKGTLLCGKTPAKDVHVRLFRVKQGKKDDVNQVLDEKDTGPSGMFHVEGNTNGFPLNETDMAPVVTFYHTCDEDASKVSKNGYRKFTYIVPSDYVVVGPKAKKTYDLGSLNIELEFPEEKHDKEYGKPPKA